MTGLNRGLTGLPGQRAVSGRRDELSAALATVRDRISAACSSAGRNLSEVRLLPVTKTFPAQDVALLTDLGLFDAAEARDAEAAAKVAAVTALRPSVGVRWHMVGRVQGNKAKSVAQWAAQVQSVDSPRLVQALDRAAGAARAAGSRRAALGVLVQASLDGNPSRGGCPLPDLEGLADRVVAASHLRLEGVMAIAPLGVDPGAAFAKISDAALRLRRAHPGAVELSAGMSGDLEEAIAHGSTCVRVGTALLGGRPLTSC
jgi:pyridoxal phosphate enzyme (YggS family)